MKIRRTHRLALLLGALAFALGASACGGGSGGTTTGTTGGSGSPPPGGGLDSLRIVAMDAPFPYESVKSASVTIKRVEIRESGGAFQTLIDYSSSGGLDLDLVKLKNGTVGTLFEGSPAPGSYDAIRLVVLPKEISVMDGGTMKTFTKFKVPSGPQTGIKIYVDPPILVTTKLTREVVLDFDLASSFVVQGNPNTPAGIKGFIFKPVARAVNSTTAGSLTFRVKSDSGTPGDDSDDIFLDGAAYTVISPADTGGETSEEAEDDGEVVAKGSSGVDPKDDTRHGYVHHPAIPAGTYELEVESKNHESYEGSFTVDAGNLTDLGVITLTLSPTNVHGTVTTELTTTSDETVELVVAGATVEGLAGGTDVVNGSDTTNNFGEYAIVGLPLGDVDVRASATGYSTETTSTSLGVEGEVDVQLDFVLTPLTDDVSGTVTDTSASAVADATVKAVIEVNGEEKVIAETTTDADGHYTLAALPTGSYQIVAVTGGDPSLTGSTDHDHVGGAGTATVDVTVE